MAAVAQDLRIKSEITPLVKDNRNGINSSLVQETKPTAEGKSIATGNFYILVTAGPTVSLSSVKEHISKALDQAKQYDITGEIVNFRVKADGLLARKEKLAKLAKNLLGDGKERLVMEAATAPSLSSKTAALPGFFRLPLRDLLDPINADGHVA